MTDFSSSQVDLVDPVKTMMVLAFVALLVERALTAVYSTTLWKDLIKRPLNALGIHSLRLYVAIIVNLTLAYVVKLDALAMLAGGSATDLGMIITGLVNSGGAKTWADIFASSQAVREGRVAKTQAEINKINGG